MKQWRDFFTDLRAAGGDAWDKIDDPERFLNGETMPTTDENKYQKMLPNWNAAGERHDVTRAFAVTCPARQHAIKKLLMAGERGGKSVAQDLREAIQATERALELAIADQMGRWG